MKNYPKKYENLFSGNKTLIRCNIDDVSTDDGTSLDVYNLLIRNTVIEYQRVVFDYIVKVTWLSRKFRYMGMKRNTSGHTSGCKLDGAWSVFMRYYVGVNLRMFTANDIYKKVVIYFDDFFPDFSLNNPFKVKYEYPYKYMLFEHLLLVYQMDERLELLKYGEENKMAYVNFLDYILNYINCYEEEHGRKYIFFINTRIPYYIKNIEKYGNAKACYVRKGKV